jgi:hypothetical protein
MSMMMQYVVFSIGQFCSSDLDVLKSNLSNFYRERGSEVTGNMIWDFITKVDASGKAPIYHLRMGMSLYEFWASKILVQFPLDLNPEIQNETFEEFQMAWLSMCEIKPVVTARIREFIDYLNENPDTRFILVSHTNHAHFEYIKSQLQKEFEPFPEEQFLYVTSMDSQCEDRPSTLRYAFKNCIDLQEEDEVISCLNAVTTETVPEYVRAYYPMSAEFSFDAFKAAVPEPENHRSVFSP